MASFFSSSQYSQDSVSGSFWSLSKGSHNLKRSIITLALDSAKLSLAGGRFNLEDQPGDKFNQIEGELGRTAYSVLCTSSSALALVKIHYCQRGLRELANHLTSRQLTADSGGASDVSQAEVNRVKEMRDVINHDYLVLEFLKGEDFPSLPTDADPKNFCIVAEKLGGSGGGSKAGIYITYLASAEAVELRLHEGVVLLSIDCGEKKFSMKKIEEVLFEAVPHYNLRDRNCWDYATATTKRLLTECMHVEGTTEGEKARLKKEHDNLESHLNAKGIFSTFKAVMDRFCKGVGSSY